MAINKYMRAALRALSYAEPDIKRNYRLLRTAETAAKAPKLRSLYHTWEHRVLNGGHEVPVRIFLPGQETDNSRMLQQLQIRPKIRFATSDSWAAIAMVRAGLGITLAGLPVYYLTRWKSAR